MLVWMVQLMEGQCNVIGWVVCVLIQANQNGGCV